MHTLKLLLSVLFLALALSACTVGASKPDWQGVHYSGNTNPDSAGSIF